MKELKITKANYKDYINLYKTKDKNDKKANKFDNILKITEFLISTIIGISLPISIVDMEMVTKIIVWILFGMEWVLTMDLTINQEIKKVYQIKKNKKLKEMFPTIDTEIETEELIDNLIRENIITRRYVRSGKYIKKGEYKITIQEERFLKYQNYLEQLNEQKEKEEKRKQRLIHKYNEIKKQMLDEYIRKPTSLNFPLFVPKEELDKAKGQVKKLVKSRQQ